MPLPSCPLIAQRSWRRGRVLHGLSCMWYSCHWPIELSHNFWPNKNQVPTTKIGGSLQLNCGPFLPFPPSLSWFSRAPCVRCVSSGDDWAIAAALSQVLRSVSWALRRRRAPNRYVQPTPSLPFLLCETEHPDPSLRYLYSDRIWSNYELWAYMCTSWVSPRSVGVKFRSVSCGSSFCFEGFDILLCDWASRRNVQIHIRSIFESRVHIQLLGRCVL
jgi:hypothetical protein